MTKPKRKMVSLRLSTYRKLVKLGTAEDSVGDIIEELLRNRQGQKAEAVIRS